MSDLSERLREEAQRLADREAIFYDTEALLREAADALDAAEKERAWLPIGSAPKDRRILVCDANGEREIAHWNTDMGGANWISDAGYNQHDYWNYVGDTAPTHWRPLPLPPQSQSAEERALSPSTKDETK